MSIHNDPRNFRVGKIEVKINPLTGDWFVYDGTGSPYICHEKSQAKQLAKQLDKKAK